MFQMLTGAVPFTADTPMGVMYKHVHERLPDLPKGTEVKLHSTIISLLRKSPKQRIQSATQGLEMLEGADAKKIKPPMPQPKQGPMTVVAQPQEARPGTDVITPSGIVRTARPQRRVSKIAVLAGVIVMVAAAVYIGTGVAPDVEDYIATKTGLNLGLRVVSGQKFKVERHQDLSLGSYQIQIDDDGLYTVKSVKKSPLEVVWDTKRDRSAIQVGTWKKSLAQTGAASSTWPNKPGSKDSGWALSPLTLDSGKLKAGEGGQTKSGLQWHLESIEKAGGRKVAKIAFSNLPTGNVLLDSGSIDAISARIQSVKNDEEWKFPKTGWKTTRIEDKIDTSTGIPTSIEIEQTHAGGFKFKTAISMTSADK
jgi:hypothetical protein